MKRIFLILSIVFASAIFAGAQSKSEVAAIKYPRQDLIGSWKLTKKSANENRKNNDIVEAFTLKEDSASTVQYNNSIEEKLNGTWKVNAKKELGKKFFKISIETDVVISYWKTENHYHVLGLKLKEKNNKYFLSADKGEYEKL